MPRLRSCGCRPTVGSRTSGKSFHFGSFVLSGCSCAVGKAEHHAKKKPPVRAELSTIKPRRVNYGQVLNSTLAGFGDELTDWMFETVFQARVGESAFAVRTGGRWSHGPGVLWVWALRWLGPSRRLNAPDAIVPCFQKSEAEPFVVSPREAMALTANCEEATFASPTVTLDPEPTRRLAQAELRSLLST